MSRDEPVPRSSDAYVAVATLFHCAGALDLDAYQAHLARLGAGGVAGVVPVGALGEYEALSGDERAAVMKAAKDAASQAGRPLGK